jgi:hypothetical protein
MGPERLWYCSDCVVRGCPFSCTLYSVQAQQAAKQSFSYTFIDGEMQAGRNSICFCLTGVLL